MERQQHNGKSLLTSQVIACVSVTLVLMMLGIIALLGVAAHNVATQLESEVGLTVVTADSLSAEDVQKLGNELKKAPFAASVDFVSPDDVLKRWNTMMGGNDTLLDVNPFLPEWEVKVKPAYASSATLEKIATQLRKRPDVEEVAPQSVLAQGVESTVSTINVIFLAVAGVLALISFVLISNTVRLAVYARRLTIHAMRLVGATHGFIRRPFLLSALYCALIAATVASLLLGAALFWLGTRYGQVADTINWVEAACVAGGLYVTGILICLLAALFATNRYLRLDYDRMFS